LGRVSKYHSNVEKGIRAFGEKYPKRFEKVCDSATPIHINHPKKKMYPILYYPDVIFVTKIGKRYIFEVLDSELKDTNLMISDIVQSCLSPNTSKVIFIVKKEKDQDQVVNLGQTITDNLISKGISKRELPRINVFYILRSEAKSSETVTEILADLLLLR
jgi:transposase